MQQNTLVEERKNKLNNMKGVQGEDVWSKIRKCKLGRAANLYYCLLLIHHFSFLFCHTEWGRKVRHRKMRQQKWSLVCCRTSFSTELCSYLLCLILGWKKELHFLNRAIYLSDQCSWDRGIHTCSSTVAGPLARRRRVPLPVPSWAHPLFLPPLDLWLIMSRTE